jgi:hypothetical protein
LSRAKELPQYQVSSGMSWHLPRIQNLKAADFLFGFCTMVGKNGKPISDRGVDRYKPLQASGFCGTN